MEIIPVLDLKKNLVVHAIKGQRNQYQPVQSPLSPTAGPVDVAKALIKETRCRSLYIADLDAIQGQGHNRDAIGDIASHLDTDLWVDQGISDPSSAKALLAAGADVVIIGSETLSDIESLKDLYRALPPEQLVFSLDIKQGRVISMAEELNGLAPIKALDALAGLGMDRIILLTLDVVGSGQGPDLQLIREAGQRFAQLKFIAGGGIKTPGHLEKLAAMGANAALVATSLHKGWITKEDIASLV